MHIEPNFINDLFTIVLIPLLGILTKYAVEFINAAIANIKNKNDNQLFNKYLTMLNNTIVSVVAATNQTYVNSLKEQGKFDQEAQKIALKMSFDTVKSIIAGEAETYLTSAVGDLNLYIHNLIEKQVLENKQIKALTA